MKQKEVRESEMKQACVKHRVEVDNFNAGSFRLTKDGFGTIDYYPKSRKAFYHSTQEWIEVEDIASFVAFEFSLIKPDNSTVYSSNRNRALEAINKAKRIAIVENNGVVTIVCEL